MPARTKSQLKCFACGREVDVNCLECRELIMPICPDCYEEFRHLFEEQVPAPLEFKERCNLK